MFSFKPRDKLKDVGKAFNGVTNSLVTYILLLSLAILLVDGITNSYGCHGVSEKTL